MIKGSSKLKNILKTIPIFMNMLTWAIQKPNLMCKRTGKKQMIGGFLILTELTFGMTYPSSILFLRLVFGQYIFYS